MLGQSLHSVLISFVKPGEQPVEFFSIHLESAHVQSMTTSYSEVASETISFTFERMKIKEVTFNNDGSQGAVIEVTCDFVRNQCF